MKIVCDDKIPFLKGVFEPFAEVQYASPKDITPEKVREADALIIRTRTQCNSQLLQNSAVKIITTATIGYDHIDQNFCKERGIEWYNSPGCNTLSVCQYVLSALLEWITFCGEKLEGKTIGIVGVGNIGSRLSKLSKLLGLRVLQNDPPRAERGDLEDFVPLNTLLQESDIVTLHTPLNKVGKYPTYHLANADFFENVKPHSLFINASRGEVLDTQALKEAYKKGKLLGFILDVYEGEPQVEDFLLKNAFISTPHIAGYSTDGKANGTAKCVQLIAQKFGIDALKEWYPISLPSPDVSQCIEVDCKGKAFENMLHEVFVHCYDIKRDSNLLKANPSMFELLRENYPIRRELPFFHINLKNASPKVQEIIERLQTISSF